MDGWMSLFGALGSWDVCGGVGCGLQASMDGRVEWVWTPSHGGELCARLVALVSGSSVAPQRVFAQLARYGLPLASLAPPSCTSCGLRATRSRLAQGRGLLSGEKVLQMKC